jgi:hypothetical protein
VKISRFIPVLSACLAGRRRGLIDHERGDDAIAVESGEERRDPPVAAGGTAFDTLAFGCPTLAADHIGGDGLATDHPPDDRLNARRSSRKINRLDAIIGCMTRQTARASTTSGRCCSLA